MADLDPAPTDSSAPLDSRVDALLAAMTLEEKVGQLAGTYVGTLDVGKTAEDVASELRNWNLGSVAAFGIGISRTHDPQAAAALANRFQRIAVEESRLGIPLLLPVDAIHGHAYVGETTVLPHGLGLAATRNPDLVERAASVTATEARATGATVTYSPTADVTRDQRWGRTFETFGESSLLCGDLAAAKVRGYQGGNLREGLAACVKHFPAYGQPERGEEAAPVDVSPTTLRRTFVPPFEKAVDAGVEVTTPCYSSIDSEPVHGSERFLRDLLREQLGFDGIVAADWGGVKMLAADHRVVESRTEATALANRAGIDVDSVGGPEQANALKRLVEQGHIPESQIDASVRRVLSLKLRLGLFEDPYVDPESVRDSLRTDHHRETALEAARESMTLLKNDGVLPLSPEDDLLVTGPNADDLINQLGGWSVMDERDATGITIREGIEGLATGTVTYERGSGMTDRVDVDAARQAAADADAAVVALGEGWYLHEFGSQTGSIRPSQFPSRLSLDLPDAQQDLLEAVAETGTPTVLVLITGRPLAITWAAEHVPGIVLGYFPGSEGGRAVAETLFGQHNPGGSLPISIPRSSGHLPTRFDHLPHPHPIGKQAHPPAYDPLYPFGHGLSYTDFVYDEIELSDPSIAPDGTLRAELGVRNVGDTAGTATMDWYLRDRVSSRVRPVREHVGYDRVTLDPGERGTATVRIDRDHLGVVGPDGDRTVEPGEFELIAGQQSVPFEVR